MVSVVTAVAAQVLKSGTQYLGRYVALRLQYKLVARLQNAATKRIMDFNYAEVSKYPAGILSGSVGHAASFSGLVTLMNTVALSSLMMLSYVATMFFLSVQLTISTVIVIGVVGYSLRRIVKLMRDLGDKVALGILDANQLMVEYFNAPKLLRIFHTTDFAERNLRHLRIAIIGA